jgi:hypothetical protein
VLPAEYANLNQIHMSDIYFSLASGSRQISRKQASELLGDVDAAEAQLVDYYYNADRSYQVVEGIISPVALFGIKVEENPDTEPQIRNLASSGGFYTYKVDPTGFIHPGRHYSHMVKSYFYAWIHRLAEAGIPTFFTMHWGETANLVTAMYKNESSGREHTTLQRVIVPRLYLKEVSRFESIMIHISEAVHIGVGPDTAKGLHKKFKTVEQLVLADVKEIAKCPGVGKKTAEKIKEVLSNE